MADETERELAVSESLCHTFGTLNLPWELAEDERVTAVLVSRRSLV